MFLLSFFKKLFFISLCKHINVCLNVVLKAIFSQINLFGLYSVKAGRDIMTMRKCGSRTETSERPSPKQPVNVQEKKQH